MLLVGRGVVMVMVQDSKPKLRGPSSPVSREGPQFIGKMGF